MEMINITTKIFKDNNTIVIDDLMLDDLICVDKEKSSIQEVREPSQVEDSRADNQADNLEDFQKDDVVNDNTKIIDRRKK